MIEKFKTNAEVIENGDKYLYGNHVRMPISMERGEGVYVFDKDGNKYLDFVGGIAVNVLGHGYPALVEAVSRQAAQMIHCSNLFYTRVQADAAAKLVALSGLGKAFFANSGAEANEGAIKAARKYAHMTDPDKSQIITAWNSFHGRTLATLTATGQPHYQEGCGPLPAGFDYVHYNDIEELESMMSDKTCAVMLETVQGEGGVYPPKGDYLKQVRALCDKYGALLILDEVQAGMGRCGTFFAYDTYGVKPDIVTLAKGLAGGVPIGAFLCTDEVAKAFHPGDHGTTFGGNPIAAAGANVVLDELDDAMLAEVNQKGEYLKSAIAAFDSPYVDTVRGMGLMIGIVLKEGVDRSALVKALYDHNLLVLTAGPKTIRLLPPLVISQEEMDTGLAALKDVLVP